MEFSTTSVWRFIGYIVFVPMAISFSFSHDQATSDAMATVIMAINIALYIMAFWLITRTHKYQVDQQVITEIVSSFFIFKRVTNYTGLTAIVLDTKMINDSRDTHGYKEVFTYAIKTKDGQSILLPNDVDEGFYIQVDELIGQLQQLTGLEVNVSAKFTDKYQSDYGRTFDLSRILSNAN
ncbi:hypothetical protein HR060_02765 [Catenovulum sp. SM1970]|uniref:hypothetical protein n=1 Tax=Marinifaba aquimaris TaxID=2741323 RepID=UPI0015745513|nr:hypothetical protein [Marinifaba aquimaris]NTS75777.1 hypothetical protein [Marinifaba aquimaris]